MIDYQLLDQRS